MFKRKQSLDNYTDLLEQLVEDEALRRIYLDKLLYLNILKKPDDIDLGLFILGLVLGVESKSLKLEVFRIDHNKVSQLLARSRSALYEKYSLHKKGNLSKFVKELGKESLKKARGRN